MFEHKSTILIVDDNAQARELMEALLQGEGFHTLSARDGEMALQMVAAEPPDLILLDLMMPGMDGFTVARRLKSHPATKPIPVIVISALEDRESQMKGLEAGVEEYLTKPVDHTDLRIRIRNLLRLKEFNDFLKDHNMLLELQIQERTKDLNSAFVETIFTLQRAAEFRDDETGDHVRRISFYAKKLAEAMGMDDDFCETIFYASPMHDIGKIGIPDRILLKLSGLTSSEWEIMQSHTTIGDKILSGNSSPFLQMGQQIALNHHERWNGGGYPHGKRGEEIPLPARIMQLADVYDALRSKRPYKEAFSHEKTMDILIKGDGRTDPCHFDPQVFDVFQKKSEIFAVIFAQTTNSSPPKTSNTSPRDLPQHFH